MKSLLIVFIAFFALVLDVSAEDQKSNSKKNVKYKKSRTIDFESLLIQGERKRAEIMVVTGDAEDDLDGLLRLRDNFVDHQSMDFGENVE